MLMGDRMGWIESRAAAIRSMMSLDQRRMLLCIVYETCVVSATFNDCAVALLNVACGFELLVCIVKLTLRHVRIFRR